MTWTEKGQKDSGSSKGDDIEFRGNVKAYGCGVRSRSFVYVSISSHLLDYIGMVSLVLGFNIMIVSTPAIHLTTHHNPGPEAHLSGVKHINRCFGHISPHFIFPICTS